MTELLTPNEVAERLRWSVATVYTKLRAGLLPSIRLGEGPRSQIRVDAADIEEFLQAHRSDSKEEVAA